MVGSDEESHTESWFSSERGSEDEGAGLTEALKALGARGGGLSAQDCAALERLETAEDRLKETGKALLG